MKDKDLLVDRVSKKTNVKKEDNNITILKKLLSRVQCE